MTSHRRLLSVCFALAVAFTTPAGAATKQKIAVFALVPVGADPTTAHVLTDALVGALATEPTFDILSKDDMQTLLNVEQQKQLLGCEQSSCLLELGGALGAALVVTGSVGKLGNSYLIQAQLLDVGNARVLRRATERTKGDEDLIDAATRIAAVLRGQAAESEAKPAPETVVAKSPIVPVPPSTEPPRPEMRFVIELGTTIPATLGLRFRVVAPSGLYGSLAVGALPSGYTPWLGASDSAVVKDGFGGAKAIEARLGWAFSRDGGWRADLNYTYVGGGSGAPKASAIAVLAGVADLGVAAAKEIPVSSHVSLIGANVAYEFRLPRGFEISVEAGLAKLAGGATDATFTFSGLGAAAARKAFDSNTANAYRSATAQLGLYGGWAF